jgi:hypothetical protein
MTDKITNEPGDDAESLAFMTEIQAELYKRLPKNLRADYIKSITPKPVVSFETRRREDLIEKFKTVSAYIEGSINWQKQVKAALDSNDGITADVYSSLNSFPVVGGMTLGKKKVRAPKEGETATE